jgi:hypothetical protein
VSGGAINLTAGAGIGTSTAHPLVVDTPLAPGATATLAQKLTATSHGDAFIQEKSGDLRLNTLNTNGHDAWISVPAGSLIDANNNQKRDDRTVAQLKAGQQQRLSEQGQRHDQLVCRRQDAGLPDVLDVPPCAVQRRHDLRCVVPPATDRGGGQLLS